MSFVLLPIYCPRCGREIKAEAALENMVLKPGYVDVTFQSRRYEHICGAD